MKKILLIGSAVTTLALFMVGGLLKFETGTLSVSQIAEAATSQLVKSSSKNSEQIPDSDVWHSDEFFGIETAAISNLVSQVVEKASGAKLSSDVFRNVVGSSFGTAKLSAVPAGALSASTPTRVRLFGPNGTHWPSLVATPYVHDDSAFATTVVVDANWSSVKAELQKITKAQAEAGYRILIKPGVMQGNGNSTGSTPVLEDLGSETWNKRVVVAPRDGFGSVEWKGGTRIHRVYGVAFAEFIVDGINFGGNNRSALVRILNSDYLSANGARGTSAPTHTVEITEYVQPNHFINNGDAAQVQVGGDGSKPERYLIEGSYFAPRFYEYPYTGGKPHTDTFQFAGSTGYNTMTFRDSVLFGSNNTAIQTGNIDGLALEHTLVMSGETSLSRYPHLPGGATEATTNAFNGSGKNLSAVDSIFIGGMGLNTTDAPRPWASVTNTKISKVYGSSNQPLSGSWTVDTSLENWREAQIQAVSPYPTRAYLDSIWKDSGAENNTAPVVNAGADRTITLPINSVALDATVTDDGRPTTTLVNTWTKVSGAGTVSFANEASVDTVATFSTAGTYVLRLTSNDGDLSTFDDVTVTVNSQVGINAAPVVSAGTDLTISLPVNSVALDATVTDDGLPSGSSLSYSWTRVSGAGTVSFVSANSVDTIATFSTAGTYVLRLTATDGSLSASDDVTVIVNQGGGTGSVTVSGELKKWHKVTLSMTGPTTSESATPNPFKDYRANVTFTHSATGKSYTVPGYFAADGNAGETSATGGNIWKAHFAPDETGTWAYSVSFRTGSNIAISTSASAGTSASYFDGSTGSFSVTASDKTGRDLRGKGRLVYDGEHYLKFSETGERFIKAGVDSPENLLAYEDFDNTPRVGNGVIKTYSAHAGDYVAGDASWKGGKGTELVGAVNYLANQGLNSISFLTFNTNGDDGNVYPYTAETEEERFDTSKLDQWGSVLDHATKKGMYLHFKMMEAENDGNLTNDQFKLYARELVARYGHNLALNWNLGEENGRSVTDLKIWATYLKDIDPYDHNRVLHLICGDFSTCNTKYFDMMGSGSDLTGFSMQGTSASDFINTFNHVKTYVDRSAASGKKWVIGMDEPGDASTGVTPDGSGNNHDNARKHALWGTIMAGGQGVEWYYGGSNQGDITLTDFRSRNNFYTYSKYAIEFLTSNGLPVVGLTSQNGLVSGGSDTGNKVLAKTNDVYLVQLINGGSATLNLSSASGTFNVKWLNPRTGAVTAGANVSGGGNVSLVAADSNDWIVLIKKGTGTVANQAPVANAGVDQTVTLTAGASLTGSATDDGLPAGSSISYAWTKVSGAGTVSFANASAANTTATFSVAGTYVLQLSATDGSLAGTDTVTITVTATTPTSVFNSAGGVVVVETENTSSSLGSGTELWALRTPGNAAYVADATNNAHLEYRSTDVDALYIDDTPGDVPLEYTFKINEGGYYQLHIRSHKNIEDATRPDLNNDAFIKVNGVGGSTFTAGPNAGSAHLNDAPLSMLQSYTKIAGGSATTWAWADQLDAGGSNNKRWPVYGFQTGGTYTLTMSGRSRGFAPDRIVLRKVDTIPMPLAKNYAIPESSKVDGGTNPNIAPITFGSTQVRTTELVNVRPGASLTSGLVGRMPFGSVGTIVGGPTVSSDNITWWQVDFAATTTDGWTGQDNLKVIPGTGTGANQAPTVSAGADVSLSLPATTATLTGTATDSDGTIASLQWTKISGGAATLTGQTTNTLSLSGLSGGTYVFRLIATDNDGATASDEVSVTVSETPTGPIVYIRSGATGSGSNWSDALGSIPASANLVRGTTYYIADGSYGSYSFSKAESGTSMITFKKATQADHGTDTGWTSSYGDGTADFTYFEIRDTGYFVLDGGSRTGDKFEQKGIVVKTTSRQNPFYIVRSNDVRVSNVEMDANFDQTKTCQVSPIKDSSNVTFNRNYMHSAGDDGSEIWDVNGLVFEDNEIAFLTGYSNEKVADGCANGHSDGVEIKTLSNAVFNRNYFHDIDSTSSFFPNNWLTSDEQNIWVTNNIFHTPEASATVYFHNMSGARIFHNTFMQGIYSGVIMESDNAKSTHDVTDFDMANNIVSSFSIKDQFVGTGSTRDSQQDIDHNLIITQERHSLPTYVPNTNDINLMWKDNKDFSIDLFAGEDLNKLYNPGRNHPNKGPNAADFTPVATNPGVNRGKVVPTSVTVAGTAVDISRDFFGNNRIGTPDMGAIEFRGVAQSGNPLLVGVWGTGSVTGNGINCGTTGSDCYEASASGSVTLTAAATAPATFKGWIGGTCSGTGTTCTVSMTSAKAVTAWFEGASEAGVDWNVGDSIEVEAESVNVRTAPGGTLIRTLTTGVRGTVLSFPREVSGVTWYEIQYSDADNTRGWTGSDRLKLVGATTNNTLSVTKNGSGSVTSSPVGIDCGTDCSQSYSSGTSVTLTATPATGATFNGWSGACTGTSATCIVAMTSAKSVTAEFTTVGGGDTTAPSVPTGLTNAGVTATTAALSWTASTDNTAVTGYEILRDGVVVGTAGTPSYTATGLTMNTPYSFSVRAFDAAGNKSANSTALSVTTSNVVDTQVPTVPTNLTQAAVSNTSATITWTASTDNVAVTSYEVFRGATPVGTSVTTSFTDNGLTRDTAYSYTVKAKDAAGNTSASSAALSVRTSNADSKIPVRVKSFGPNGTHWPSRVPTPFIYDDTIPNKIIVEPTWAAIKTALQTVTKAQADAGTIILVKPGTIIGNGKNADVPSLSKVGSSTWSKRVTIAPRDGYGTVKLGGAGTRLDELTKIALAGFIVDFQRDAAGNIVYNKDGDGKVSEVGGIKVNCMKDSALAWMNIKTNQTAINGGDTCETNGLELVEIVNADHRPSHDDTINITPGGTGTKNVMFDGSYFSPRWFINTGGHTDTLQFSAAGGGPVTDTVIRDSAFFGSNNGANQIGGSSVSTIKYDNTLIVSGAPSRSRYPWQQYHYSPLYSGGRLDVSGFGVDTTKAFNGSPAKLTAIDSIFIGNLTINDANATRAWDYVENTRSSRSFTTAVNDPLVGDFIVDTSLASWTSADLDRVSPLPTDAYLAQIWAKDGTPITYRTLTTSVTGSGTVSGTSVPTQQYVEGTSVTLTATPATGATFTGWGGACAGTSMTCVVTMSSDKSVTASFSTVTNPSYTLTVAKAGTGTGTVTGSSASQSYPSGTSVTLTATPATGSTFAGWSGACTGTATTCTLVVDSNKTATATFNTVTVTQYSLTVNKTGTGTGTVSGATSGQQFPSGTVVTLTATPATGSAFAGWSGSCSGTSATCNVTMSANKTVSAAFNTVTVGQVATPTFSPSTSSSNVPLTVAIASATAGAEIRYTTNGSTPTSSSTLYSGPITVSTTQTVKAIAIKSGMTNSSVGQATYTISSGPTGPSVTSSTTWAGKSFSELSGTATRTGKFEVTYVATPLANNMDAITGLSDGTPSSSSQRFTVFGPIVRFNADGKIDARNGGAYAAVNSVSYVANANYNIRMEVDVVTRTYSVWVDGVQIANNYAFRSEQANVTRLTHFGYVAVTGTHRMANMVIGSDARDTTAPTVPAGLTVSNVTQTSAQINWSASTDAVGVTGYEILRNGVVVGTSDTTSYVASGLTAGTSYSFTVRAFDVAGNKSAASSALTVTTQSVVSMTLTSAGTWAAKTFQELSGTPTRTGTFEVTYTAKPSRGDADVLTGLSNEVPTSSGQRFTVFGPIVIFDKDGKIKARNGSAYAAEKSVSYVANGTYNFRMQVNVATRTYSVWVDGVQIATNYAFRSEQSTLSQLSYFGYVAVQGSHQMSNIVIGN